MQLVDIGANLAHDSFDADREAVLSRAEAVGVTQIVVTGSCVESARRALALAQRHPGRLFATAGLHPHHASSLDAATLVEFRALAREPEVVATGEMGLDFYRDFSPRPVQEEAFRRQLELAVEIGKPVFLHQRDAHERFIAILLDYLPALPRAVVHCFTGTQEELRSCLDHGLYIGITGWICDERRGRHLLELVGSIPEDRLMIETDAPYLLPRTLRPKPDTRRNEPMYLPAVVNAIATATRRAPEAVAESTTHTARTFFGLPAV